jgi:hypothetical protein
LEAGYIYIIKEVLKWNRIGKYLLLRGVRVIELEKSRRREREAKLES